MATPTEEHYHDYRSVKANTGGSADSDDSESGEDELDWTRHGDDPIAHLDSCIESLEDSLEEWESTDG